MNLGAPQIDLSCQQITPKKLAWIMDVGESTVADWLSKREVDHFKKGRLIRMSPESVLQFIVSYTVRTKVRNASVSALPFGEQPDMELFWDRVRKLIAIEVEQRLAMMQHAQEFAAEEAA